MPMQGPPSAFDTATAQQREILYITTFDVIMGTLASQITSLTIVYSTVYSDADQRNHQSSASLAFVQGIHRGPVYSPHKWPVTRKMFPFDDVIMLGDKMDLTVAGIRWTYDHPILCVNHKAVKTRSFHTERDLSKIKTILGRHWNGSSQNQTGCMVS